MLYAKERTIQRIMPLYTFIAEFDGGTYISQHHADSFASAPIAWAEQLDLEAIEGLSSADQSSLIDSVRDEDEYPVPITGVLNTWCFNTPARNHFILVHFVETKE